MKKSNTKITYKNNRVQRLHFSYNTTINNANELWRWGILDQQPTNIIAIEASGDAQHWFAEHAAIIGYLEEFPQADYDHPWSGWFNDDAVTLAFNSLRGHNPWDDN